MSYFRPNIEQMQGYQPGFQPTEPDFVKLNTNENPYPPSPAVMAVLRRASEQSLRKYPDPTAERFRRSAARMLGTAPDRILCGNGSDEILSMAVRSFCGEGDALAFPTPTYTLYETLAQIQGARTVTVPFPEDYSLPPELADTGARLTLLCNPNAPSGTLVPPEQVEELAGALAGVLLVDEAYVDFADADCLALVDRCPNVIIARTLSKSHSLAGIRFGFAVAQEPLVEGMVKVKDSYNVNALTMQAAEAALWDQGWVSQNVAGIKATRARLTAELERMGFRCWPSQANFVLARAPRGRDAKDLFDALFERKILVRYFAAPRLDDCLRISVGTEEEMDVLLAALGELLADPAPPEPAAPTGEEQP